MRRNRKVKILATLGPSSDSPEMIERLYHAGVDVFRINMSHASHEKMKELHGYIRNVKLKTIAPLAFWWICKAPNFALGPSRVKKLPFQLMMKSPSI